MTVAVVVLSVALALATIAAIAVGVRLQKLGEVLAEAWTKAADQERAAQEARGLAERLNAEKDEAQARHQAAMAEAYQARQRLTEALRRCKDPTALREALKAELARGRQ